MHHMAMRAAKEKLSPGLNDTGISGIILLHPYFWSKTPIDEKDTKDETLRMKIEAFWMMASPNSKDGTDDPLLNVVQSESVDLSGLGCGKVLVMVAEKDALVRQGWGYAAKLEKSGWKGEVEVVERLYLFSFLFLAAKPWVIRWGTLSSSSQESSFTYSLS